MFVVHLCGLAFVSFSASLFSQGVGGGVARGEEKPCAQDRFAAECAGFAGEVDEDRLRDILGEMVIAHLAEGSGVDQVDVPGDQRGEG